MNEKQVTMAEGIERFISYSMTKHLVEDTVSDYKHCFRYFLNWLKEKKYCSEIDIFVFEDYKHYLKGKKLSKATVDNYLRHVKVVINYFIEKGWTYPFKMKLDKRIRIKKEAYTEEEIDKLLKKPNVKKCTFSQYRNWVVTCFLISTGVRRKTLANVKICDLNFEEKIINFNVAKNDMDYYLPMTEELKAILLEYLDIRGGKADDYLFCTQTGTQLNKTTISTIVKRYNKNHGVERSSVHLYRHTVGKNWALKSGNQRKLQSILGHATAAMSQEYVNIYATDFREEFESNNLLDERIQSKKRIKMKRTRK